MIKMIMKFHKKKFSVDRYDLKLKKGLTANAIKEALVEAEYQYLMETAELEEICCWLGLPFEIHLSGGFAEMGNALWLNPQPCDFQGYTGLFETGSFVEFYSRRNGEIRRLIFDHGQVIMESLGVKVGRRMKDNSGIRFFAQNGRFLGKFMP